MNVQQLLPGLLFVVDSTYNDSSGYETSMHLQQTKRESAASGGPQYYFHDLSESVKTYLRTKGAVQVALVTPYGATKSHFFAVGKDHKLENSKPVPGKVGHDRIQQGKGEASIGEQIRYWYELPAGQFERIDIEVETIDDAFYIRPIVCKYAGLPRTRQIAKVTNPLTFTKDYMSPFWKRQLDKMRKGQLNLLRWSVEEMNRVAEDHRPDKKVAHVQEPDLLRASGPLRHMGVSLGAYVGKGYDCISQFEFLSYPPYRAPIEIKKFSRNFSYQQKKYGKDELSRAVIFCANHDHQSVPANIDVIELEAFYKYGRDELSLFQ